jgi:hypothetical protein
MMRAQLVVVVAVRGSVSSNAVSFRSHADSAPIAALMPTVPHVDIGTIM